jgi:TolA-binding protein
MAFELSAGVNIDAMYSLNQHNINRLIQGDGHLPHLKAAFSKFSMTIHSKAKRFLQKHGMDLYKEGLNEMQEVSKQIHTIIDEVEQTRQENQLQIQKLLEQQDRQHMIQIAQQYPVINTLVPPQPHLMFVVKNCEQLQQQLAKCKQFHNVAIYTTKDNEMCVIADITPIPRPYSTNVELKEQWYQIHSNVYNPDVPMRENQNEEPDDIEEH